MIMNMVMMLSLLTPEIKRLSPLIFWPTVILVKPLFSSCSSFDLDRVDGKRQWLTSNTSVSTLVMLLGLTNMETLLDSRIFSHWRFSMGWEETTHLKIKTYGLVGNILENVPQLVIQGLYLDLHGFTIVTIVCLVVSTFSLIMAVIRRVLLFVMLWLHPERRGGRGRVKSGQDSLSASLLPRSWPMTNSEGDEMSEVEQLRRESQEQREEIQGLRGELQRQRDEDQQLRQRIKDLGQ